MTLVPRPTYTVEEYLELEKTAEEKSEFFAGEIFAMAGGSPRHALICMNLGWALRSRLLSGPCRPYGSDLRIATAVDGLYTYPDISVVCGPLETVGPSGETATNPSVIIEVLSDSTEAYVRGAKFTLYRAIASLRHYVLVSQTSLTVEIFTRQADGAWRIEVYRGLDSAVKLDAIGVELPLAEVFLDVQFSAATSSANPSPG